MQVTVEAGPEQGRSVDGPDRHLTIGRGPECDLVLSDPAVATRHVVLERLADGRAVLRDVGGRGTLVEGQPVLGPVLLHGNERIQLGRTVVSVALSPTDSKLAVPPDAVLPTGTFALAGAAARPQGRRLGWAFAGMGALFVLMGLIDVAGYGPKGTLIGLIASTVPVPLLVLLVLRRDPYEPEPKKIMAFAFLWGAAVAAFVAGILNLLGFVVVAGLFGDPQAGHIVDGIVIAPVVEEILKGAVLFLIVWKWREEFNGVVDGIIYAAMVGLGFAVAENVGYYGEALMDGQLAVVVVLRGIFSPFAHPLFTSLTGIGLAIGLEQRDKRVVAPLLGLAGAILLHSLWNTSAATGLFVLAYPSLFVPAFLGVLVAAERAARSEGQLIRRHLWGEVGAGLLSADEVAALASVPARRQAGRLAAMDQGEEGKRACRRFQHAAVELAFARARAERESRPVDPASEAKWRKEVADYRARLLPPLPPAPPSWGATQVPPGFEQMALVGIGDLGGEWQSIRECFPLPVPGGGVLPAAPLAAFQAGYGIPAGDVWNPRLTSTALVFVPGVAPSMLRLLGQAGHVHPVYVQESSGRRWETSVAVVDFIDGRTATLTYTHWQPDLGAIYQAVFWAGVEGNSLLAVHLVATPSIEGAHIAFVTRLGQQALRRLCARTS